MKRRIAIIGGGWAGLAAAVSLKQSGERLCIFEASRHWGGRARTVELEGKALDNGQHIFVGAYAETLRLMRAVGLDPQQLLLRLPLRLHMADGFNLDCPPWPAPMNLLWGLLNAKGLNWSEKMAALRFGRHCRRINFRLPADESLISFLRRTRQPDTLCRQLWEPLCVAALNTPAEHASAQIFLNVLRDTLGAGEHASDLLLPQAALGALFPEAAAAALHGHELRLGEAVRSVESEAQGIRVNGESFDAAILAVGPHHAADLLPAELQTQTLRAQIDALRYEPIYTCYLQYGPQARLPFPMLGFSGGLLQWAFDRGVLDAHPGLIAAVISARGAHEDLERGDLVARIDAELRDALEEADSLQWSRVIAEKRATWSCRPGVERPDNITPMKNLYLAGDYTASDYPATIEAAVRSGLRAAQLAAA